jgi:hypothetical protein
LPWTGRSGVSIDFILAAGGIAFLIGGAVILFLMVRSRNNPMAAFLVALAAAGAVFMVLAIPFENLANASKNELMYLASGIAPMAGALLAALFVINKFFPKKTAANAPVEKPAKPRPVPREAPRAKPAPAKPAGPPPDVFISYKRDERAEVLAIAKRLEALKLRVWFDAEMRSGTTFDTEIDRQVRAAKVVLVCWSPGAVTSDWVRGEATIGRQRGVLAAVMLKACDLPTPFNLVHADNLVSGIGPQNPEWLRAVERIGQLAGRPGLATYEALELGREKDAYAAWIAQNSGDPLFDRAVERLKQL